MKIAVFGSTGGNGRLILTEAMRRGHEVTAFARRPDALAEVAGLAAVVGGDARDPADAGKAVAGQDAVIMTVSARGEPGASTAIARTVIESMAAEDVRRLVATTKGPYSLTRRAYAAALVDEAENSAHVRHIINITGGTHV
jgi:putative NADH-flavin reductase